MNEKKLHKLFKAVRNERSPAPPAGFDVDVMRTIRREERGNEGQTASLLDGLGALFPRVAWAAVLIIIACVLGDYFSASSDTPGLTDQMALLSEEWPFVEGGF
jgi:hypothetical protein